MYMSELELLNQGGFGCVYHPGITCKGKTRKRKNVVTKLQLKSFNSKNEIKISKMIKNIENYKHFFLPVSSSCKVDVRLINNQVTSQCKIVKEETKPYVLMSIPYVENQPFFDYLSDIREKDTINVMVSTADYLLDAVSKLVEAGIVHFDLKGDNIIFNTDTDKPQIIDFGISIPIERPRFYKNVRNYFYIYAPEYYVWPIEVHIACFVFQKSADAKSTITTTESRRVAKDFVSNNKVLEGLSHKQCAKYLSECIEVAERYVGLSSSDLVEKVKASYKTWDSYALGILFLKLIRHVFHDTPKSGGTMPKDSYSSLTLNSKAHILHLLEKVFLANIDADPSKRPSLLETKLQMNKVSNMLEGQPTQSKVDGKILAIMKNDIVTLNTFISREK